MTPRNPEHGFPQLLLDTHEELIVDLFAGGGGASCGIEMATGRQVDVAINHDAAAVALHMANHPQTHHYVADVFEVDPREVCKNRPVGLLWASPDCTDHSKAKGGKPIRNKKRRALAWVVVRWAGQVRPRVIALENVEEFSAWGPLVGPPGKLRRCEKRKGKTFRRFVRELERLGYQVEWRELRACDYGAPTIRKRLFLIARCDGRPIVWPQPTHGPEAPLPYRTAAECIDWSIPMLSIFATSEEAKSWAKAWRKWGMQVWAPRRPLADATLRRIARGVVKYVVENPQPYIVPVQNSGWGQECLPTSEPLRTITAHPKGGGFALAAPFLAPRYGERDGQEPRIRSLEEPSPVVVPTGNGGNLVAVHLQRDFGASIGQEAEGPLGTVTPGGGGKAALVASFLAKHYGGVVGSPLSDPKGTVTTIDRDSLVGASLAKLRGTSHDADPQDPLHTVSAGGTHHGLIAAHLSHFYTSNTNGGQGDSGEPLKTITSGGQASAVYAFLQKYYGQGVGSALDDPTGTIPTKDRMGLVTVQVEGEPYVLTDIAMRMLQPRELYRAQGFPDWYRIDQGADGRRLSKTEQVRMVGNSVSPPQAAALVRANCPDLVARDEVREGRVA